MTVRRGVGVRALLAPSVVAVAVSGAACTAVAALSDGASGAAAALVATVVVLAFLLAGQLPVAQAAQGRRGLGALLLLVGYSTRLLVLLVAGVAVVQAGSLDRRVLGLTAIVVGLAWTAATVWTWLRWRPPVVDVVLPSASQRPDGGPTRR